MAAQKDAKTGRFLPGNTGFGGRPRGARSKLTTEFFEDFYGAWQTHGPNALKQVAEQSPRDFVRAAAMLMPKDEVEKQHVLVLHEGLRAALEEMTEQSGLRRAERAKLVNPPKLIA